MIVGRLLAAPHTSMMAVCTVSINERRKGEKNPVRYYDTGCKMLKAVPPNSSLGYRDFVMFLNHLSMSSFIEIHRATFLQKSFPKPNRLFFVSCTFISLNGQPLAYASALSIDIRSKSYGSAHLCRGISPS